MDIKDFDKLTEEEKYNLSEEEKDSMLMELRKQQKAEIEKLSAKHGRIRYDFEKGYYVVTNFKVVYDKNGRITDDSENPYDKRGRVTDGKDIIPQEEQTELSRISEAHERLYKYTAAYEQRMIDYLQETIDYYQKDPLLSKKDISHLKELLKTKKKLLEERLAKRQGVTKSALDLLNNRFGYNLENRQPSLFDYNVLMNTKESRMLTQDQIKDKNKIMKYNNEHAELKITDNGIKMSIPEQRVLHAILTKLTQTDYKGNHPTHRDIPLIKIGTTELLDLCGVEKYQTSRGFNEYSGKEREDIIKALFDLSERKFYLRYTKTRDAINKKTGKKDESYDTITEVSSLIKIVKGYEHSDKHLIEQLDAQGKAEIQGEPINDKAPLPKYFIIQPDSIILSKIANRYILLPADMYTQLRSIIGHRYSSKLPELINYVLEQATLNRKDTSTRTIKTLAYTLRMDRLIESRQWIRIRKEILALFKQVKQVGYITSYEPHNDGVSGEQIRWTINADRMLFKQKEEQQALPERASE
jgi:hypothetical protein